MGDLNNQGQVINWIFPTMSEVCLANTGDLPLVSVEYDYIWYDVLLEKLPEFVDSLKPGYVVLQVMCSHKMDLK